MVRHAAWIWVAFCTTGFATEVLTHHNNVARTGAVLDETVLSPASIRGQQFGKLMSLPVDGQIYAQPLVVTGLEIPGKGARDVLFVATMRNFVYAFDAVDGTLLWKISLGAAMPFDRIPKDAGALLGQYNIRPYIGVTSTPAIDREKRVMYVVGEDRRTAVPGAGFGDARRVR